MSTEDEDRALRAGEYVLGVLDAAERARLEEAARRDPELARAIHAWEERLTPLTRLVPPSPPPPRVWRRSEPRPPPPPLLVPPPPPRPRFGRGSKRGSSPPRRLPTKPPSRFPYGAAYAAGKLRRRPDLPSLRPSSPGR